MTITHELGRLADAIKQIEREITAEGTEYDKTIKQGILDAKDQLQRRTQGGKGLRGSLRAYTPSYRERKRKAGRNVSPVDFLFSGQLWASFTAEFERQGRQLKGFLFFRGGRRGSRATNAQVARGLHADRPFFDLLDDEKQIIENAVNDAIEEAFKLSDFD